VDRSFSGIERQTKKNKERPRDRMLNIITYILTFVIITTVLISAVIVHLFFDLHRYHQVKKFDADNRKKLHEMIFEATK
jgi:hypothetical protein